MPNLSYIESLSNSRNRKKHSLFEWVKKNPKQHIQDIYENKEPKELYTRAERFRGLFQGKYPGDGVLYFHDDLLCPLSEAKSVGFCYKPHEYNLLFNYLYSFRSDFTYKSRGALAVFLMNCHNLAIYLYPHRKKFDTKAWTDMIEKMRVYKSFNQYTDDEDNAKRITQFIWKTILLHEVPLSVCDNNIFMHLYYAYTYTAIQRFFFLANSRAALKEHIANAYRAYRETCLLLNCWYENAPMNHNDNRRIPQMSSIRAMERFHDLKAEEILEEQRKREFQHIWENLSKKIREVSPEWYLPEFASDIRLRGQQHHNCVGSYVDRHFNKYVHDPKNNPYGYKMLLLFTDFGEAEVHVKFDEVIVEGKAYIGCVDVSIMQAKTSYNKDIKDEDYKELKKITRAFKKIPLEDFNPVVAGYTSELQSNSEEESETPAEDEIFARY